MQIEMCEWCGEEMHGPRHNWLCPRHPNPYTPEEEIDNDALTEAWLAGEEI